ncbi:MAG: hypothetical protein WC381_07360 [Kiritimatiellia bacterium]|jgi:hypothetical protein
MKYSWASVLVAGVMLGWGFQASSAAELGRWKPREQAGATLSGAGATALQLSLCNPLQLFREDFDVYGLRLNLPYGKNASVYGADIGVFGWAANEAGALQLGVVNRCGSLAGAQIGGLCNLADKEMSGFQLAVFSMAGQLGNGFQLGLANVSGENYSGVQIGGFNYGRGDVYGLQLGVVNVATTMTGLQIGLLNFIWKSQFIAFAPIINGYF